MGTVLILATDISPPVVEPPSTGRDKEIVEVLGLLVRRHLGHHIYSAIDDSMTTRIVKLSIITPVLTSSLG